MENKCPPPKKFSAALGVKNAEFLPCKPAFITRGRSRGRFAVGVRYEREVQEHLALFALGRADLVYKNGPWLSFQDDTRKRWCQPDALLVDAKAKTCTIAEVKYQHTSDAWYQLMQLYLPVLRCALPGYSFGLLEIVHWFDPATAWPDERIGNVPTLDAVQHRGEFIQVLIFNKRRERRILEARRGSSEGAGEAARPIWPAEGTE